ncbi:leucine-rich repeat domain-containing protein [Gynuella sunshinyii]|uniref:Leucine-rich repeat (LRR) protein n=1 Tax=Gynuella sunshinyii YC6258 TaxID=1445510 RepID=A0A0C5VF90_9GAMM|nr:leucine-rich repeat domain-containing protein [Gynuella sunshinyii]AJQ97935.1 leucine-rich repeat (LRR) protein [Gynuella sunshinyii YC6258]
MILRTLCYFSLTLAATACQAKPLPEPPFSVEQMEAFADPVDLEVLYGLHYNQDRVHGKESIHYGTAFLEGYEPYPIKRGLVTRYEPGVIINDVNEVNRSETERTVVRMKHFSFPTWDREGHLINLIAQSVTPDDLSLISRLKEVRSLFLEGYTDTDHLDLNQLSPELPLQAATFYRTKLSHPQRLCDYQALQHLEINAARVIGDITFKGCIKQAVDIFMASADIDALTIQDLPELVYLYLGDSRFKQLHIDGSSLPKLQSLTLSGADIPSDVDSIQLPEGLLQLYLENVTDDDISKLKLPKSLQYLNLRGAKLQDYGFIAGAVNLTALVLEDSNFKQWPILKRFSQLRHLKAGGTSLTDAGLPVISQLTKLQTLDLSATNITNANAIENLQELNFLYLFQTPMPDLNSIPYIENISDLGLPLEQHYKHPKDYPSHIKKMFSTFGKDGGAYSCNHLKPCEQPPWNFDSP